MEDSFGKVVEVLDDLTTQIRFIGEEAGVFSFKSSLQGVAPLLPARFRTKHCEGGTGSVLLDPPRSPRRTQRGCSERHDSAKEVLDYVPLAIYWKTLSDCDIHAFHIALIGTTSVQFEMAPLCIFVIS